MAKIDYKKFDTVLGDNWHAVVDGSWLFYPCGENLDGLAYHICGYNGDAQNRLRGKWAERGVHVF